MTQSELDTNPTTFHGEKFHRTKKPLSRFISKFSITYLEPKRMLDKNIKLIKNVS